MSKPESQANTDLSTGSPKPGEPVFLAVGKLRRPHGVRGEIVMEVLTDFPERLKAGGTVYAGDTHQPLSIRSRRAHAGGLLVAFEGYDDPEACGKLRNELIYVRADDRPPLPEGEYYHHQLVGLKVVTDMGQSIGTLTEILSTGANDVYVVRSPHHAEILLPAIGPVILDIDLGAGQILVHLLPGLLPDE